MSPPKKKAKSRPEPSPLGKAIRFLCGPGLPVASLVLLAVVAVATPCLMWLIVGDDLLGSDDYMVGPQQVHIVTPQPDWIHSDIRSEVFRSTGMNEPMSIMDDGLTRRIRDAFALHPWVAEVGRVSKGHPARVDVELLYRRPVCMVDVSGRLYPVDAGGVLLPSGDFSSVEATRYPKLTGVDEIPVGIVGENWGDVRVSGGAETADVLLPVWNELKLLRIVPSTAPEAGLAGRHTYMLITRGGTRVFWGLAPGTGGPGELPTAEKIARLKQYVVEHGTLDGLGELDVYRLESPRVSSRPKR